MYVRMYGATFYFPYYTMYYLLISKYILSIKPDKQKTLKKKQRKKNLGRKTSHKKFIHDIKAPILGTKTHAAQPSSSNEHKKRSDVRYSRYPKSQLFRAFNRLPIGIVI